MAPGGEAELRPESQTTLRELEHPLPGPMQEHMLANMRDHLATLNMVIGDIADAKFDPWASKLLEERLGMSSLSLHHAAEICAILSPADARCWWTNTCIMRRAGWRSFSRMPRLPDTFTRCR